MLRLSRLKWYLVSVTNLTYNAHNAVQAVILPFSRVTVSNGIWEERGGGAGGDNFDSQGDNIWGLKIITDIWNKIHILFYFLRRKLLCLIFCWFWSKQFLLNSAQNLCIKGCNLSFEREFPWSRNLHTCIVNPGEGLRSRGWGGPRGHTVCCLYNTDRLSDIW